MLIEDGGIVVLGGLIQDGDRRGEQRVPYLGRIPVIGALFKTRSRSTEKSNLMVFIRPKILRDGLAAAIDTDAKYNYIREEQIKTGRPKTEVLPLHPVHAGTDACRRFPRRWPPRETAPAPVGPDGTPATAAATLRKRRAARRAPPPAQPPPQ